MPTTLIVVAVAGVALLWRTYRYDSDNKFNTVLDRLPYALRKPITCGLCFTFWISLLATIIFSPFAAAIAFLPYRFALGGAIGVVNFLIQWFALGTAAVTVVYVVDTFFEISHYLKHAVGEQHDHSK